MPNALTAASATLTHNGPGAQNTGVSLTDAQINHYIANENMFFALRVLPAGTRLTVYRWCCIIRMQDEFAGK